MVRVLKVSGTRASPARGEPVKPPRSPKKIASRKQIIRKIFSHPSGNQKNLSIPMESENLDIESITEARRQAIERTIEPIATEKLRALGEKLFPALDHPWRQVFFDFLDQHAQTTVYHAATNEGAEITYSPEVEKGLWFTRGGGVGPLQAKGLQILKEAVQRR
jgi:hypothetical protein